MSDGKEAGGATEGRSGRPRTGRWGGPLCTVGSAKQQTVEQREGVGRGDRGVVAGVMQVRGNAGLA